MLTGQPEHICATDVHGLAEALFALHWRGQVQFSCSFRHEQLGSSLGPSRASGEGTATSALDVSWKMSAHGDVSIDSLSFGASLQKVSPGLRAGLLQA